MNWRKSILVRSSGAVCSFGKRYCSFNGNYSLFFCKACHSEKYVQCTIRTLFGNSAKVLILKVQKNLAIITSLYYDENLKNFYGKQCVGV